MSKYPSGRAGAPRPARKTGKKARWTPQQKAMAKRAKREAIGGDGRRDPVDRAARDVRRFEQLPDRDGRPARGRDGDERSRDFAGRGERPARSFDRDDRGPRRFDRGERPRRFEEGGERASRGFGRDDRGPQRYGRDERPGRDLDRAERPARSFDRDDRGPRRFDRGERPRRVEEGGERASRGFGRDDRGPQRFDRDDRGPQRFDRDDRGPRRGERPRRFEEGGERASRGFGRDDRGPQRYGRDDRPARRRASAPSPHVRGERTYDLPRRPDLRPAPEPVAVTPDNAFSLMGLPLELVERLARDGIAEPFPIQAATIPDALAGKDVLGRARTGSGKTLSFGLPTVARLMGGHANANRPRCVILVPTRELAMQVADALQPFVHVAGLRHKLVAGGMPYQPQLDALERGLDILIATPGRLRDLMSRGAADLSEVEVTIVDEADHMAEMGFLEEISEVLDATPGGQRLLFSATLDHGVDTVVDRYMTDPVTHETDSGGAAVTTMTHHTWLIRPEEKKLVTAQLAARPGRNIVFTRTKLGCERVARELRAAGVFAAPLHGDMAQNARNRVITAFRDGQVPVLVATDVAARGIHVDGVGMVIQVDPPADHKDYLHRSGRTARAGEEGAVVTLVLPHQRKQVQRLIDEAGVGEAMVQVRLGEQAMKDVGAQGPTSGPIPDEELQRIIAPPRRPRQQWSRPRGSDFRRGRRGDR